MITAKHFSVIGLAGLAGVLGLALTQGCSSSDPGTAPFGGGSGGAPAAGAAGSGVSGGGTAGAPAGGALDTGGGGATAGSAGAGGSSAGAGAGGSSAGTGGSSAGAGGSSAGAGGSTAGAGGSSAGAGGGSTVAFAQIKTLFAASCGVGTCHNKASGNLDYQGTTDLHTLLTTAIPAGTAHCVGSTIVVPNDQTSFLLTVVKTGGACPQGGGSSIPRMPIGCTGTKCLTDAQVKLISDWIAGGALAN